MLTFVKSVVADADGATAIEYGLIAGLISVAIIAGITVLGTDISGTLFNAIAEKIAATIPSS